MKKLTKFEILKETKKFYTKDTSRRALDKDGNCRYETEDGKRCAVGRCQIKPSKQDSTIASNLFSKQSTFQKSLMPQYRGHDTNFWNVLQTFHDGDEFWDEDGLTKEGKDQYKNLKKEYRDS